MPSASPIEKHIIVALVDNKPGVVSRISGLFTRRGYNIESFVTCITTRPEIYHLTITVISTREELDLLIHQLGRVMEVISIFPAGERACVVRELMLLRLSAKAAGENGFGKLIETLGLKIAASSGESLIIEASGDGERLEAILRALSPFGIQKLIRSGAIALEI